jgi:hypothetical protein
MHFLKAVYLSSSGVAFIQFWGSIYPVLGFYLSSSGVAFINLKTKEAPSKDDARLITV